MTAFKPERAGQLNFYLAAVDAQIKSEDDKPVGVAEYQLLCDLPEILGPHLHGEEPRCVRRGVQEPPDPLSELLVESE